MREINVGGDDLEDINVWVERGVIVLIILSLPVIRPRRGDDSYQFLRLRPRQHLTLGHTTAHLRENRIKQQQLVLFQLTVMTLLMW